MLGEREAVAVEVRRFGVHGVDHVDVTLLFPDRHAETARLGSESVPLDLQAGERVLVATAMNVVIEVRRPPA